ncbi:MAG: shikimate dehydrogenase [Acidimicrobiia bacterium]
MTTKAGVIGHPVKHSLSPLMHEAAYKSLNLDWSYEAIDVSPENSPQEILDLFVSGYKGLNVTMPLKNDAFNIGKAHGAAARLQIANTLISVDSEIHCYSTDGEGFVKSLRDQNINIDNCSFLVVGAGGASRSICDALVNNRAEVLVTARKLDASTQLVEDVLSSNRSENENRLLIDVVDYSKRDEVIQSCDVIVNATPVGMTIDSVKDNATPINTENISENHVVVDTIYHPLETQLLKEAKSRGARTINGIEMLIYQGALSFKLMTGLDAPIDVMREAINQHLQGRSNEH